MKTTRAFQVTSHCRILSNSMWAFVSFPGLHHYHSSCVLVHQPRCSLLKCQPTHQRQLVEDKRIKHRFVLIITSECGREDHWCQECLGHSWCRMSCDICIVRGTQHKFYLIRRVWCWLILKSLIFVNFWELLMLLENLAIRILWLEFDLDSYI